MINLQILAPYIQKLNKLSWNKRLLHVLRFLRGFWVIRHFNTKGLLDAGKRIKIVKQYGEIHMNGYGTITNDVHIIVIGQSKEHKAVFCLGLGSYIGDRTIINVTKNVSIGDDSMISWNCDIRDTCWHQVRFPGKELKPLSLPIIIQDHVWIGSHTIIERGVTIGKNSVIAAGSKVITDIPPNSFAAGNPAKVVKQIDGWDRNPDFDK
jgi:acetyltransferase-like isoleucine patch superfamily enzyme